MLEYEYKKKYGMLPKWIKDMPLSYKKIILKK
jgi:hypothetical protein